jgi:hypothetical protein
VTTHSSIVMLMHGGISPISYPVKHYTSRGVSSPLAASFPPKPYEKSCPCAAATAARLCAMVARASTKFATLCWMHRFSRVVRGGVVLAEVHNLKEWA